MRKILCLVGFLHGVFLICALHFFEPSSTMKILVKPIHIKTMEMALIEEKLPKTVQLYPSELKNWNLDSVKSRELSLEPKSNSSAHLGVNQEPIQKAAKKTPEKKPEKKETPKKEEIPKKKGIKEEPPKTKPTATKSEPIKKEQLLAKAKEKMRQLNQNRTAMPSKNLMALNATETHLSAQERDYVSKLISTLQAALVLPEKGILNVRLTLKRNGSFSHIDWKEMKNQNNRHYVENQLPQIQFPAFGSDFEGEQEHTFELSLES